MAIAHDAVSESHTGTTGSASQASFTWNHIPSGTPKGILIFTFTNANADDATSVTYGGVNVPAVSGGRTSCSSTEAGDCKTWFLGSGIPTGTQAVVVNRNNNANVMYAVAISVTAATAITSVQGVVLQTSGASTTAPAQQSVDDGSLSGSNSLRYAGCNYGGSAIPVTGAASTALVGIDYGTRTTGVVRETTAGTGARSVGFTDAADDVAAVHLAIIEGKYTASNAPSTSLTITGFNATDLAPGIFINNSASNAITAAATTIATTLNLTAGKIAWVIVSSDDTTVTVDDTLGNTYTERGSVAETVITQRLHHFTAPITTGGSSTVTAHFGASVGHRTIVVLELANASAYQVQNSITDPGNKPTNSFSATPTSQPAYGLALCYDFQGGVLEAGTGYTLIGTYTQGDTNPNGQGVEISGRITTTTSQSGNFGNPSFSRVNIVYAIFSYSTGSAANTDSNAPTTSYAITGSSGSDYQAYYSNAASTTLVITGVAATSSRNVPSSANSTSYVITGNTGYDSPSSFAVATSLAITGIAGFDHAVDVALTTSLAITGVAATSGKTVLSSANPATYAITGNTGYDSPSSFAVTTSLAITGVAATSFRSVPSVANPATYTITANTGFDHSLSFAPTTSLAITGVAASSVRNLVSNAPTTSLAITGNSGSDYRALLSQAATGSIAITGVDATSTSPAVGTISAADFARYYLDILTTANVTVYNQYTSIADIFRIDITVYNVIPFAFFDAIPSTSYTYGGFGVYAGNPTGYSGNLYGGVGRDAIGYKSYYSNAGSATYTFDGYNTSDTLLTNGSQADFTTFTIVGIDAFSIRAVPSTANSTTYAITYSTAYDHSISYAPTTSLTITGVNASSYRNLVSQAATASYALTYSTVYDHIVDFALTTSLAITGIAATSARNVPTVPATTSLAITGAAATSVRSVPSVANSTSFAITASTAYDHIKDFGLTTSLAITGSAGSDYRALLSQAATTSYTITGVNATSLHAYLSITNTASYAIVGFDVPALGNTQSNAATTSYTITGIDTGFLRTIISTTNTASDTITGVNANSVRNLLSITTTASYVITGFNTNYLYGNASIASPASYVITGFNIPISSTSAADTTAIVTASYDASSFYNRIVYSNAIVFREDITFYDTFDLSKSVAESMSITITFSNTNDKGNYDSIALPFVLSDTGVDAGGFFGYLSQAIPTSYTLNCLNSIDLRTSNAQNTSIVITGFTAFDSGLFSIVQPISIDIIGFNATSQQIAIAQAGAYVINGYSAAGYVISEALVMAVFESILGVEIRPGITLQEALNTILDNVDVPVSTRHPENALIPANVKQINNTPITGTGAAGNEWGPA